MHRHGNDDIRPTLVPSSDKCVGRPNGGPGEKNTRERLNLLGGKYYAAGIRR